jgi:hypothetical protein
MTKTTKSKFAVFILTHGRANNVITYSTLRKQGYTGKIYLMIDDEDKQASEYKEKYGKDVIVFNKQKAIDYTDSGDNFNKRNSVVYARNWNFVIAKEMGIDYFLQLDDDYGHFYNTFDNEGNYITQHRKLNNLDSVCDAMVEFLIASNADAVCMSQGGDFIGGPGSKVAKLAKQGKFSRKAMNAFFMNTAKPFKFMGRINEDVNAYVALGGVGKLFITVPRIRLEQTTTQANAGGLTEIYLDLGTYVKSFYSVMYAPSCVKIQEMGVSHKRLHHRVKWKYAVPEIVSADYKKVHNANVPI